MLGNEIVHDDALLRVVTRKNVTFAVWSGPPGVSQIHALQRAADFTSKRGRPEQLLISTVLRGAPNFSEEVRDELVRVMRNKENFRLGTAHLILLDGMAGTAVRAFLSTVKLLSRNAAPMGVFGKTEEALLWGLERVRGSRERWIYSELFEAHEQATKDR